MLPTFFPVGNRAKGELNSGKLLNDSGGGTTTLVPPDRYWRARTSPRTVKDVRTGLRESTSKPLWANFTWPLSIGG
jgi:predicted nicotinamide N-methyase